MKTTIATAVTLVVLLFLLANLPLFRGMDPGWEEPGTTIPSVSKRKVPREGRVASRTIATADREGTKETPPELESAGERPVPVPEKPPVEPSPSASATGELERGIRERVAEALQLEDEHDRFEMLAVLAANIAQTDSAQGWRVLEFLESARDRNFFAAALIDTLLANDFLDAVGWASQIPDLQVKNSAFELIGKRSAALGIEDSLEWADSLQNPSLRSSALRGVLSAWAREDMVAAGEWAYQLEDPVIREQLFTRIAKMMALENPPEAANYVLEFPNEQGKQQALAFAVTEWATRDLDNARIWAAAVPDPSSRLTSLTAVARGWANVDPQSAAEWAATLQPMNVRRTAVLSASKKWAKADPATATQWVENLTDQRLRSDLVEGLGDVINVKVEADSRD